MRFFEIFTEVMGWLQIVASPLLVGLGIGAIIYFPHPSTINLIIALSIVMVTLIFGIILATRIWKKKGTIWFLSRIMATPELDNITSEKETANEETRVVK